MYECHLHMHSISPRGKELLTYEIVFPRSVLAEVVTHRILTMDSSPDDAGNVNQQAVDLFHTERTALQDLSKSSASSRAIPFSRMVEAVRNDPYIPERWSKGGPGMQESGWLEDLDAISKVRASWLAGRDMMIEVATKMHEFGVHKQDVNRLLEPWGWVRQIVTGTEWNNFFALRTDKDAHPAFRKIARMMYLAKRASTPRALNYGEWHVPYVGQGYLEKLAEGLKVTQPPAQYQPSVSSAFRSLTTASAQVLKISAARCAWVSYDPPGVENYTHERAFATFDKLIGGRLKHVSPTEHQGTPMDMDCESIRPEYRSNLSGWLQARKLITRENIKDFSPSSEEINSWLEESPELSQYYNSLVQGR